MLENSCKKNLNIFFYRTPYFVYNMDVIMDKYKLVQTLNEVEINR